MAQGFKSARILLDEQRSIYYSGQVLNGNIECNLSLPINYTAITLNYIGKGTVQWTEKDITYVQNGYRRKIDVDYGDEEEYFNVTQCISGGMGVVQLQPGVHNIPFQFLIPSTAPSSYTSDRGRVMYTVTAYIDYSDPNMDRDILSKEFQVVAPMDLNKTDESVQRPLELEIEQFYSSCGGTSGPLNITMSLPMSGYCPGQCIPIHVMANNQSSAKVKRIVFQLIKKESFHSRVPKSDYIPPGEVLLKTNTKPIGSGSKRDFTVDLVVPDMIAPNLENCHVINVGFFLKVIVQVSGCNDDYENETEIYIGLVPISTSAQQYIHPLQRDLPRAPIPQGIPQGIPNPPLQNTAASVNNAANLNTGHAKTNAGYTNANIEYPNPNANAGYPNTGYSNTNSPNLTKKNPVAPISTGNIGFVIPVTPPGVGAPNSMGPPNAQSSYVPHPNFTSASAPPH